MKTHMIHLIIVLVICAVFPNLEVWAKKSARTSIQLNSQGKLALDEYQQMLKALREQLKPHVPKLEQDPVHLMMESLAEELGPELTESEPDPLTKFMAAHAAEKGTWDPEIRQYRNGSYNNARASLASMKAAQPLFKELDAFLSNDSRDHQLVKCALLTAATPERLAQYAQQSKAHKKRIDDLLADPVLMKEMLLAGGAKDQRYGRSLEIYEAIQARSKHAGAGHLRRLALATALEFAAPELTGLKGIDPVERYLFFEKSYLDKELHKDFDQHSTWEYRHVVNGPNTNEDMAWMREMLWNYRPDYITAPEGYKARYVGLMNSEFGHKRPEWDLEAGTTKFQQTIDRGGQCGPKAFFGRCLSRSFGVPTWGARLRKHAAMSYWTPKGWTTILGVSWRNGYWIKDKPDTMRAILFKLDAMAREYPEDYMKARRAEWVGDVLGEAPINRMHSGSGGLWKALALNKLRNIVNEKHPVNKAHIRAWEVDSYPRGTPRFPEQLMTPEIPEEERLIEISNEGVITIPATACAYPCSNTQKVLFMAGRDGRYQLHYKRWSMPEPVAYVFHVKEAGDYQLTMKVVTVNREQYFHVKVNGQEELLRLELPYTIGKWEETEAVTLTLKKGKNTLILNRSVPYDFHKNAWSQAGPEFGGITLKSLELRPVN